MVFEVTSPLSGFMRLLPFDRKQRTVHATHPDTPERPDGEARSASVSGYRGEELTTRDAIVAAAIGWQRLEGLSGTPSVFQSFDVCLPWLDAYVFCDTPTHRAHVLAFYDGADTLIALAPFAHETSGLMPMAEWLGEPLVQYGDLLMDPACDPVSLRAALLPFLAGWQVQGIHLRNVRADSAIARVLDLASAQVGPQREAAIAALEGFSCIDDYNSIFSKRSLRNRRQKRNGIAKHGELTFEAVPAGARAGELCDIALKWKLDWLAERGLSSRAFMDDRALATLRAAVGRNSAHNPFTLYAYMLNDQPLAIEIGLANARGSVAFMGSYDPAYEAKSPGKLQMEATIEYGMGQGWTSYDMLAPMAQYKQGWANKSVGVADYMLPIGFGGRLYRNAWLHGLRPASKRLWERLPAVIRSAVLRLIS